MQEYWKMASEPKLVDRLIDTDLKGLEYCTYYATLQMKKQKEGGTLVNIASVRGVSVKPREDGAIYASAKFGVVGYSATLHLAYKGSSIKMVCFCPDGMKTDLFRQNPERLLQDFISPDAAAEVLIKQMGMERYGLIVLLRGQGACSTARNSPISWSWTLEENVNLNDG